MSEKELLLLLDVLSFNCDHLDNILGGGPDDEKLWAKRYKEARKARRLIKRELSKLKNNK